MNKLFTLKIESDKGVALISRNATQTLFPIDKFDIPRNLNMEPIAGQRGEIKQKCCIETQDIPDVSLLKSGDCFKISSLIEVRQYGTDSPAMKYVDDSLETGDGFVTFRPIFSMILTNFKCKSDNFGKATWSLEFEEL
ncbi:MAG: hypothetical protein LBJ77_00485 [Holosporales bacterium]|jgi:hypothetical protein|nr:hypothetical protein [Holosporales bacterium]